ncbi:MAG: nucleotidyltransferase substrate binding protein [Anditalea sp.]
MDKEDIRWMQRLSNFNRALSQLELAVQLARERALSDLERQGLIQAFEFTHELAWNVMKDYFFYQGQDQITGSRDAIRAAFNTGLIDDGKVWMNTVKSRNKTSHTYNEETANEISSEIIHSYLQLFKKFQAKMESLRSGESGSLFNE